MEFKIHAFQKLLMMIVDHSISYQKNDIDVHWCILNGKCKLITLSQGTPHEMNYNGGKNYYPFSMEGNMKLTLKGVVSFITHSFWFLNSCSNAQYISRYLNLL